MDVDCRFKESGSQFSESEGCYRLKRNLEGRSGQVVEEEKWVNLKDAVG